MLVIIDINSPFAWRLLPVRTPVYQYLQDNSSHARPTMHGKVVILLLRRDTDRVCQLRRLHTHPVQTVGFQIPEGKTSIGLLAV